MKSSVVCLFVYNRVFHTKNIIRSLSECNNFRDYKIYIFADNFKIKNNKDKINVKLVRDEIIKFKKRIKTFLSNY